MNNLLTMKEAAEKLNISLVTLHEWRKIGKLRGLKKGYRRFYHKSDIDRLLANQKQLELDDQKIERTPNQIEFFEELKSKLDDKEIDLLVREVLISPLNERDYHKFILKMIEKYNMDIPEWFKKECQMWRVEI